ncbi:hypothetical protein QC762_500710 [Podospora pseudocomata]|uniref:Uncharacterized protein n=1 Tax=Podospora pseudocomata TaxID=2093779 RepID=A0ABR0GAF0_9PEZI|nr:hypothetical protein QC762_500710 [Podospora pseudocomata]
MTTPPHGSKRHRENDDDDDDHDDDNQRPTKITIGDNNENYPVLWSDYSQLPRLCWSLRDRDRDRDRRTSLPAPGAVRNMTIARVHTSSSRSQSLTFPPIETRYLRDLHPSFFRPTRPPPLPRRVRSPLPPRPGTTTIYSLLQEQHLLDHRIHLPSPFSPSPSDLDKILTYLSTPIQTLTTTSFSSEAYDTFQHKSSLPPSQDDRLLPDGVLDTIAGCVPAFPQNRIYIPFNAMKPVNSLPDVIPTPYSFDGVRPAELEHLIRDREEEFVIATKRYEVPVAPNFFVEVVGRGGKGGVAAVAVDGAYGARGMFVLRSYAPGERKRGEGKGEGLAFSGVYDAGGVLRLFVHFVAEQEEGVDKKVEGLGYYMAELGRWEMMRGRDEFLKGARAFRNLRSWAGRVREEAVEGGNCWVGGLLGGGDGLMGRLPRC